MQGKSFMQRAVEILCLIQFTIVGLSHIVQRHAWVDFFLWLRERGYPGVFVHGFLSLSFGSFIVAFHPIWTGWPAVLTVVGCLYLFKATLCFLLPATQMKTLGRVAHERAWEFCVPGAIYLAVAGIVTWTLWAG